LPILLVQEHGRVLVPFVQHQVLAQVEKYWDFRCIHRVQYRFDLSLHVLVPDETMGSVEIVQVAEEVDSRV